MTRAPRSARRTAAALASISLALFVLLELSARVYFFGWAGLVPSRINSAHGLPNTGFTRPSELPGVEDELRPNIDAYFKLVPFRTNSLGLRDDEVSVEKPPGTFRVAVMGSSFSLPTGVAIERAFHSLLEERFSREHAPVRYEFVNFSVSRYGPEQLLTVLEHRALGFDPDLVLFMATKHGIPWLRYAKAPTAQRDRFRRRRARSPDGPPSYPILRSYLFRIVALRTGGRPLALERNRGLLERVAIALTPKADLDTTAAAATDEPPKPTDPRSVIERLAEIQARTGVPIVIVRIDYEQSRKSWIDRAVEAHAASLDVRFLDTRDAFRGTRPRDFWIYALDPHPNDRAHAIFADAIGDFLLENQLVPATGR